ncbi:unnamed protein product [Dibothriocephalus latus]|uniref:Uncharacterized protein n=1 Tax=Dibothriocephalus latus TaxID=60516 RepID=A0A3P7NYB5_DIBLA|nr:unnamed protein product [Dibothriocephalus latus]
MQNRLLALRTANREAWRRAHEYTRIAAASTDVYSPAEQPLYPPEVLVWLCEPQFKLEQVPFMRTFMSVIATSAFLKGLLHLKPLAGENESCPEGWWDEVSREHFLAYFRCLLQILSYMQETNSMQRNLERNADAKQKLLTLRLLSDNSCRLSLLITLSAHLASTDRTLLLAAIKETREAFEQRVGVIDRCFRVAPFTHTQESSLVGQRDDKEIASTSFQALGATSEVYEYDVAKMRVSIVQPLPRLLAALYGYGIEMGLSPALLGLADEGFVNLVIERPLQMVTFLAQWSANLWLPNSDECQKLVSDQAQPFDMLKLLLYMSPSLIVFTLFQS